MSSAVLAAPVQNAISLLTSPLMLAPLFSEETIETLANSLGSSLGPLAMRPRYNIVLRLSPTSLPPSPLIAACFDARVSWNKWALALTKGKAVETIMEINPSGVTWTGVGITPIVLRSLPLLSIPDLSLGEKMEMMVGNHTFSVVPPTARLPASPASSASSDPSTLFEGASSASSSPFTSPASSRCHSRSTSMTSMSSVESAGVYVAPKASQKPSHRRTPSHPVINTAAVEVQRFMYEGGETKVVGGGVMLGGSAVVKKHSSPSKENKVTPVPSANTNIRKGRSRAASRASTWRRA